MSESTEMLNQTVYPIGLIRIDTIHAAIRVIFHNRHGRTDFGQFSDGIFGKRIDKNHSAPMTGANALENDRSSAFHIKLDRVDIADI